MSEYGLRYNEGKPRWDLVPMDALQEIVEIYSYGASKYAPRNWEKGMPWMECYASLMRHLSDWVRGIDFDGTPGQADETHSGRLTMAHVAWNAIALLTFQLRGIGLDDRPIAEASPAGSPNLSRIGLDDRSIAEASLAGLPNLSRIDQESLISEVIDDLMNGGSNASTIEELLAEFGRLMISRIEECNNRHQHEADEEDPEQGLDFLSALYEEIEGSIEDLDDIIEDLDDIDEILRGEETAAGRAASGAQASPSRKVGTEEASGGSVNYDRPKIRAKDVQVATNPGWKDAAKAEDSPANQEGDATEEPAQGAGAEPENRA